MVARYSWLTVRYMINISGERKYVMFVRDIDSRAMVLVTFEGCIKTTIKQLHGGGFCVVNNSPCESGRVLSARERVSHGCFSETLLPSRFKVLMSPAE